MGIILKQTFKGTVYSYLGVILGFVTTAILFPRFLSTKEIGLINNIVAYSLVLSQLFSLGFNSVTNRLFPYFRNIKKGHNGYAILLIIVLVTSAFLFLGTFPILKKVIISYNKENAVFFNDYIYYLIPIVLASLLFSLLDHYLKALYNATLGIFLREFFQRVLILISTLVLAFNFISFNTFFNTYTIILLTPAILIFVFLVSSNQLSLERNFLDIDLIKRLKKEIISVSFFGIIGGLSAILVINIDKIMLTHYLGLDDTGIYSVLFYFGALVLIPSRSLLKISTTLVSEAWKNKDIEQIKNIYYKSCLNQFIIGLILFLGIWVNIDNVFNIVTDEYVKGAYVVFFIGLNSLIDMATGINGIIISTSKYFRYQTYFIILLGLLTIITNSYFIPRFGINGAAVATLISGVIYNLVRFLFLYFKFQFQPFNYRYIIVLAIGTLLYFVTLRFINSDNFYFDLAFKSIFLGSTFIIIIYFIKVSEEVTKTADKYILIAKNFFSKTSK